MLSLTLAACEKERPVPTTSRSTPQSARGTVAATSGPPSTPVRGADPGTPPGGRHPDRPSDADSGRWGHVDAPPPAAGGGQHQRSERAGQSFIYTVVAGDTLAKIASRFNTTPEVIVQVNTLTDPNVLTVGQQLKIPAWRLRRARVPQPPVVTGTGGSTSTYAVQAGDTLGKIALRSGTTVAELLQLNGLSNPDVLAIGQKLKVPGAGGGPRLQLAPPSLRPGGRARPMSFRKAIRCCPSPRRSA